MSALLLIMGVMTTLFVATLLVTHPGEDYDDQLIDQARQWWGRGCQVRVTATRVEVAERDRWTGSPTCWRVSADIERIDGLIAA